ncbi:fad binding domain-containing protein [Moniliophthora roreri]|nr:fad binding domain-containing protein [Moniliophthora roreri]
MRGNDDSEGRTDQIPFQPVVQTLHPIHPLRTRFGHLFPFSWDFGIYWTQPSLPACLPKHITYEKLKAAQVDPGLGPANDDFVLVFNLSTGEEMHRIDMPFVMRLRRSEPVKLLRKGLGAVRVRPLSLSRSVFRAEFIHPPCSTASIVTAMLTDDTIEHGTLLISAQSVVRNFLFPSDPAKAALIQNGCNNSTSPCRLINYMRWIKGCRAVIIPREFLLDLSMNDSPTPHLPNGNLRLSHRGENPFRPLLLLQLPFEKNLESSRKPKVSCKLGFASLFVLSGKPSLRVRKCGITEECDNRDGKVTVVGDAADPMLPHRGQGLDNTIQDVACLFEVFRFEPELGAVQEGDGCIREENVEMRTRGCHHIE